MPTKGEAVLELDEQSAHVWLLWPQQAPDERLLDACRRLLSPAEAATYARFTHAARGDEFLLTRALVRTTLARYAPVAPQEWRFVHSDRGRPEIAGPRSDQPLFFNVSHTHGLIACLVARVPEVGVDVEDLRRRGKTVEIAERFFSPAEVQALHSQPPEQQRRRFFAHWTLKEAYVKARGLGLAIPLKQFTILLADGQRPGIAFDPRLADDPDTWQLDLLEPSPLRLLATAIRVGCRRRIALTVRSTGDDYIQRR